MSKGGWLVIGLIVGALIVIGGGWVMFTLLNMPMM